MNTDFKNKYCVGLGEVLFDVFPSGPNWVVPLPTSLIMPASTVCAR